MIAARTLRLDGVLDAEQSAATGLFILRQQQDDGSIPWFEGGQLDVWDHVEAAMGLTVTGHADAARAAYRWMARVQSEDGSWPMEWRDGEVSQSSSDTNQCAYLAVGLWHFHLVTGSTELLRELWPTLDRALSFVLAQQRPGGEIAWAVDEQRRVDGHALRTGAASILHSLTCAGEIARVVGEHRTHWAVAADRLREALVERPEAFADRSRYSMDWYYPVLGGALREEAGVAAIDERWESFVRPGHGVRCVDDHPWVTAAESSELVLALDALGETDRAVQVLSDIQHMRDPQTDGYWTGYVIDDDAVWPVEQTTWTAGAVLLALDAVTGTTGGSGVFRDYPWADEEDDSVAG